MLPAEQVTINGTDYQVRVLTMQDIRSFYRWIKSTKGNEDNVHPIDFFFNHDVPVEALKMATGLDDSALEAMPLEDIEALLDEVGRVNSFFVKVWMRRFSPETPSAPSSAPSAD